VANNIATTTRKVPRAALGFDVGPLKFKAAEGEPVKGDTIPVSVLARSAQPIQHWYWGATIHDMAGFKPAAPSVPLDYCHDDTEVIGFLDTFDAGKEGLACDGQVVPFGDDDRASEVIFKAGKGVPYQASIYFDDQELVIEEVPAGMSAKVNGYTQPGPATIFRQWKLRGVAVCPYGYDKNTSTRLSNGSLAGEVDLPISLTQSPIMEKASPAAASANELATKPAEQAAPPSADPRAEFKATLAKFTAKFGAANGSQWAAEGLTYEEALEKHVTELATKVETVNTQNTELTTKLAAIPRGEEKPASFATNEKHEAGNNVPNKAAQLSAVGKFAAELKMPK
jgi:hypothetical protein